ncbi:MAG: magnesium transporter [Flavobacteriales bacterium]|nr:magnesium transporter [Flavobacteriales bacterium]|tara:strand:+ start:3236 stop:4579 length:1344 start_codon:yes stop_codon:yes gene_type:complete
MNFKLTKDYLNKIENLAKKNDCQGVQKLCLNLLPPDIAEIIKSIKIQHAKFILTTLNQEIVAEILIELEEDIREKIIEDFSPKKISKEIISNLDSDDAADVIQELSESRQKEVLSNILDPQQANDIVNLLSYKKNSAGALMATELIKVKEDWSILRCVSEMRQQAQNINNVYTIYVVNKFEQLIGTVSLKKLLISPEKTFIKSIYNQSIISVNTHTNAEEVIRIMNKYDLIVLPVVNTKNELLGRITIDDVIDIIKEEAEKDYHMASGIIDNIEPKDGVLILTKARIPWLFIGMIGGLLGAQIIGLFNLVENPILAFFIPLITAMGGNVGVQSSAIIVQGIASKKMGISSWTKRLIKEFNVALINGLICCTIVLIVCIVLYNLPLLALTISLSLLSVMVFAALFGTFIPLILNKYKIDPALATGPFITTINDVIGLFIYFLIAKIIL